MEAGHLRENPQTPQRQETPQAITQGLPKADEPSFSGKQSSHQTQRNNKKLTSSGFKQQPICTSLAPTRNKQNSLLRRTQFWLKLFWQLQELRSWPTFWKIERARLRGLWGGCRSVQLNIALRKFVADLHSCTASHPFLGHRLANLFRSALFDNTFPPCVSCWRNVNLAGRFAGCRCLA